VSEYKSDDKKIEVIEFDLGKLISIAPDMTSNLPVYELSNNKMKDISQYPFSVRDIAVFIPGEQDENDPLGILIKETAGPLLVRTDRFDIFTKRKEGELVVTSYAYRMVFQSSDHTLTDSEIQGVMDTINSAIAKKEGWVVR
jgi:phenylalanyl-tRNA synthetase beta subunit